MTFDELFRANVPSERGWNRVASMGTEETVVPQQVDASEHLDKLDLTDADLLFLRELRIKI
jgi:hypothetical protein